MYGAIAGDIVGSDYEGSPIKTVEFPLFNPFSSYTDDTVLTVAIADALLEDS
jgi:ADP-ribosylglycohydrolase